MEKRFFVISNQQWVSSSQTNIKRLQKHLYPLGRGVGHLRDGCHVMLKFRSDGRILMDPGALIKEYKDSYYLKSEALAENAAVVGSEAYTAFYFEGSPGNALCTVQPMSGIWFNLLDEERSSLRLGAYDLPPAEATEVTNDSIIAALYDSLRNDDPELADGHVSRFLDSPHILTTLFVHTLSLRSEDSQDFVTVLKKVAEQLRQLTIEDGKSVRICRIEKSHIDAWSEVEGERIAFLDGGVARIPAVAKLEPMALRVGVYSVVPGETNLEERELWDMQSFVIADCIDSGTGIPELTDRRRLLEAARYTMEPLTALQFLRAVPDTRVMLVHGPLVNQFAMYDEGQPNYIPPLDAQFLHKYEIDASAVTEANTELPSAPGTTESFWNHFMSIYPYVMKLVATSPTPIIGVVERAGGRSVTSSLLTALVEDKVVEKRYADTIAEALDKFDITDELLFGCMLQEGEYLSPVKVEKNIQRRARERWRPVVRQIPQPAATMLKTEGSTFPFRVEMNESGARDSERLLKLVFHTARLLPRYAFPVGLDIADKYAKVPDWIARGVSAELSAIVLRRALHTGDATTIAQVKQLLTKSPRDFFFRPHVDI